MRIAIAGGTGFIGRALIPLLLSQGNRIVLITRSPGRKIEGIDPSVIEQWSWEQILDSPNAMGRIDAIVNLAGASLNQNWTRETKQQIIDSRLTTVQQTAEWIRRMSYKPEVVVQSSAVGIYGTSTEQTFDEHSKTSPVDFLSEVTTRWENAADEIANEGVRLVKLRTGVVLGNSGGAFPLMKLPFLLGAGGPVGSGKQWLSWIHLEDMVRLIDFSITNPNLSGPVNAVSPSPVTNDSFGRTVAKHYHRPYWLPLPAFLLKAALRERSTLLLDGQKVLPVKALEAGFTFHYPELAEALADMKQRG
ncbi:TIGR01777 family oxidoreductase [Paenibacillus physcomitrellae]|uniref:Epimerase family protein YfhF n=1 Tax=Paenibacillus physcomitrellae TaxID=1619311 RepID=A0ABQ1G5X9_9BACL|nr:TIGR01777 family oxidoreductase [Paenibacillus physcomitrellae]GGA37394.1 epimerase family protein YfhF [Paenibacillus physcomitrellae]